MPSETSTAYDLSVVVPVFNNGELLRTRSFPSLASSPHFRRMEVLLIDDGSSYHSTRCAVEELAAAHPNVTASLFAEGGSGSASRPRNKAHQLATAPILTYLDPDDEILGDGLWELAHTLRQAPEAQLAIANQKRTTAAATQNVDNLAHYRHQQLSGGLWRAGPAVLEQAKYRPTNLSSFAIRTQWLRQQGLEQVPGAAGQDSLFFLQAFCAATSFTSLEQEVYAYHMEVEGSQVNTVTAAYFRRCLIRERAQHQWLDNESLMDSYLRSGFERAFVWYLKRLSLAAEGQREESAAVLHQIAELYVGDPAQYRWKFPETMAFFRRLGMPSWEGLRPWAGRLGRGAVKGGKKARSAAEQAARTLRDRNR